MRHGKAHAKLSRPTAHRLLMLRNLVSSLFQHQQIKTTLAKAKEAAPLAEKMITLAKKGTLNAQREVESFLLNPRDTMPKLFNDYVPRYTHRHGGYTRIHKFGNRKGDHAPVAILELVDNPQDIKFAVTARAVGRETLTHLMRTRRDLDPETAPEVAEMEDGEVESLLRERTAWSRRKVLKFRSDDEKEEFNSLARTYISQLVAEPIALGGIRRPAPPTEDGEAKDAEDEVKRYVGRRPLAGERLTGMDVSRVGLGIAQGALGRRKWEAPRYIEPLSSDAAEGERTWPPTGWVPVKEKEKEPGP